MLSTQSDDDWVDLIPGLPRRLSDGRLVTVSGIDDATALMVDGSPVTPAEMEVRALVAAGDEEVVFTASTSPTDVQVWRWDATNGSLSCLTPSGGIHTAASGGRTDVLGSAGMTHDGTRWTLGGHVFESRAERPVVTPDVQFTKVSARELNVGIVLPRNYDRESPLPVLMDPYGGPHFQRVMAARDRWLEAQWLADQGFAVIVVDGRGTPGRGRRWARAVHGDLAGPVLDDQVTALQRAWLPCTRISTLREWRSAAGRSVATLPLSPSCVALTSSTLP